MVVKLALSFKTSNKKLSEMNGTAFVHREKPTCFLESREVYRQPWLINAAKHWTNEPNFCLWMKNELLGTSFNSTLFTAFSLHLKRKRRFLTSRLDQSMESCGQTCDLHDSRCIELPFTTTDELHKSEVNPSDSPCSTKPIFCSLSWWQSFWLRGRIWIYYTA